MSMTEIQTAVEEIRPHSSISVKVSADAKQGRKSFDNVEAIELVELGTHKDPGEVASAPGQVFPATTPEMRRKANIQFITLCWTLFLGGWTSGTTGPLIPRIQDVYHIGFAVVSLLFVFNCVGSILASVVNVYLADRIGFGWILVIGAVVQIVGYAISAPAPPYPVLVTSYFITGFGVALQDANASAYIASLRIDGPTRMGIMHAVYGFGSFCAPLVATQFAQLEHWSFHFLVSLGITIPNILTLAMVFKFKRQDELLTEIGQPPAENTTTTVNDTGDIYRQMMKQKALHLMTLFMFIYLGTAIAVGGWIVTYLMDVRGGGPSSGYISSGLYGGITVGRVALLWINKKVGEKRVIFLYVLIALAMELVVWLVPSLIGGALAVSFMGVVLGPIYPIVMNHAGRTLPPRLRVGCISWIGGFGQAGSAFVPFLTGTLASSKGIQSLPPLVVGMMGLTLVVWALVPNSPRRDD